MSKNAKTAHRSSQKQAKAKTRTIITLAQSVRDGMGGNTSISYHTYIVLPAFAFCHTGKMPKIYTACVCMCVAMDEHLEIEAECE